MNTQTHVVTVNPLKPLEISFLDLIWYQRCHDKDYHKDIFYMPVMRRMQHLTNHLHKYHLKEFNDHVGPDHDSRLYVDSLSCLLGMCDALAFNPFKSETNKRGYEVKFGEVYNFLHLHRYAAFGYFGEAIREMTKAIEGFDHIEDIAYREIMCGRIRDMIHCVLTMAIFGHNGLKEINDDFQTSHKEERLKFITAWYKNLTNIKQKHMFHEYFKETYRKSSAIYRVESSFYGV